MGNLQFFEKSESVGEMNKDMHFGVEGKGGVQGIVL
jgi:hypothetical protein